ncbi:uncharacterized protein LOC143371511 isoform X2 [Andrena cerasifolii]|uniref:uncharacterized protein LOC143371511 isoform X2 n=1 Tax=Andrena cerasifolii TaxID=2819439 RepID=UPI004037E5F5
MTYKVTPEEAIGFMRKSVAVAFAWPLPPTASKRQVLVYKILQIITAIISYTFALALLYSTYVNRHDTFIIAKCIIAGIAVAQPGVNATIALFRYTEFQFTVGVQVAAAMSHSGFAALLLWFTAARFECLMLELQETSNARTLIKCIKKQIQLRRYARQVVSCFRLSVAAAVVLSTLGLAFSCVVLMLIVLTLVEKVQNVTVFFTILLQIFMYAWPADKLKEMSMAVSQGAYESEWYAQAVSMQKDIGYMLTHQHPVTLSVSGLMPELTLRYYSAYLSNAFSIITTLHVALEMD